MRANFGRAEREGRARLLVVRLGRVGGLKRRDVECLEHGGGVDQAARHHVVLREKVLEA
jgi:hypothetical protein